MQFEDFHLGTSGSDAMFLAPELVEGSPQPTHAGVARHRQSILLSSYEDNTF